MMLKYLLNLASLFILAQDIMTPSVDIMTPSVDIMTPSVDIMTPSVDIMTPSVDIMTPSVDIMTPSVDIMTPSVDIMTPSVVILSELKSMKERIKVMEEEINELRKENREQNNQLQTLNASLKTRTEEPLPKDNDIRVAFSAFLLDSKGPTIVGPFASDRVLVYKYIFLNIGEAYDPNTGVFTAPMKGAYTFRVFSKGIGYSGHSVMAALFKNGKHMFSTHVDQSGGFYSSSNGVSLLLETGDTVNVRLYAGTCIFDNGEHHHSSFSGELLFPL